MCVNTGADRDWTSPPESNLSSIESKEPMEKYIWLFNITNDPCETRDLSGSEPKVLQDMLKRLKSYFNTMVKPNYPSIDWNYNPSDFGGVWAPWWDNLYKDTEIMKAHPQQPKVKYDIKI